MDIEQRETNTDANNIPRDDDGNEDNQVPSEKRDDIERPNTNIDIPVPPDSPPAHPMIDPPAGDGSPIGDVDDSPKQIVNG